jgi:multiple sugar transport system permease protein
VSGEVLEAEASPGRARLIRRLDLGGLALSVLGLALALLWAFPLYWSVMTTIVLAPGHSSGSVLFDLWAALGLYAHVLFGTQIGLWYINSIVTSTGVTVGVLFISATCGYAISQLRFRGRRLLWGMILASFMVPVQALIINHFFLVNALHLINTWLGVILPQLIAPVAVIVYKQFFDSVPKELREAAQIDGAGHWSLLFRVFLPVNWGITAALAIIVFIGAWNAFLWPFLAVTEEPLMNITVGISQAREMFGVGELAGAILAGLPVAVVYLLFQRKVTEAIIVSAGIKG